MYSVCVGKSILVGVFWRICALYLVEGSRGSDFYVGDLSIETAVVSPQSLSGVRYVCMVSGCRYMQHLNGLAD